MNKLLFGWKKNSPLSRTRGLTTPGCLFLVLIFILVGFVGFKFGEAYWTYYKVREQIREALVWAAAGAPKDDTTIVQKVIEKARGDGVNLSFRNVRLKHTADSLTVTAAWSQEIDLSFYTYPLTFEVNLTEKKRWHRGGLIVK